MVVIVKGIANCERNIVVFDKRQNGEDRVRIVINGKRGKVSVETFNKWRSDLCFNPSYPVVIRRENQKQSLKNFYAEIINIADTLKQKTNGVINMYLTGRFSKTALQYYFTQCFEKLKLIVEPITYSEATWIDKASCGSLMYAKPCEDVEAYSYDFISFYPSIMRDDKMLFPIKQGEFKTLTENEFDKLTFFQYGIFRANIKKSIDKDVNKLFRFNPTSHYTHIDLTAAKSLGLKIKIIEDDEPNFLYYKRDSCVSGKVLFREYVDYFYKLKSQGILGAKEMVNVLWGALTEKNVAKVTFDMEKEFKLHDGKTIIELKPIPDSSEYVAYIVDENNYFEYDLARIKPFLLAKGRKKIGETIKPFSSDLLYTHTDSLIVDNKIDIKTGTNIGELKYEGYCEDFWCKNITSKTSKTKFNTQHK